MALISGCLSYRRHINGKIGLISFIIIQAIGLTMRVRSQGIYCICIPTIIAIWMLALTTGCSTSGKQNVLFLDSSKSGNSNVETSAIEQLPNYTLRFSDIDFEYNEDGIPELAIDLLALADMQVTIQGYMAPPLQLENDFFVLTRYPAFACPFCTSAESWVGDFVVVYSDDWNYEHKQPFEVTGILDLGAEVDDDTGLVSLVRIQATSVTRLNR